MLLRRKVGLNAMWCVRNEIVVLVSSVIDKRIYKVFLLLGGVQRVLHWWLCTGCLLASPLERKYSCRRRRLQNCSLSWQILTGSANFGVGQKDRPNCRNLLCSGDNLKSDRLAMLDCLVEYAWWFLF